MGGDFPGVDFEEISFKENTKHITKFLKLLKKRKL